MRSETRLLKQSKSSWGQLADDIAQLRKEPGKLPSTTTVNPSHQAAELKKNMFVGAVSAIEDGEESEMEEDEEFGEPLIPI